MTSVQDIPVAQYISLAVGSGCLACALDGIPGTPAEWHHPRAEVGMSERAPDEDGIALCPSHHRGVGMPAVAHEGHCSVHLHPVSFHKSYGDDEHLTKLQRIIVQKILNNSIGMVRV